MKVDASALIILSIYSSFGNKEVSFNINGGVYYSQEITNKSKDSLPLVSSKHMRKRLNYLESGKAMLSPEGERIELGKNLKARGNVEDWLTSLEKSMFSTL